MSTETVTASLAGAAIVIGVAIVFGMKHAKNQQAKPDGLTSAGVMSAMGGPSPSHNRNGSIELNEGHFRSEMDDDTAQAPPRLESTLTGEPVEELSPRTKQMNFQLDQEMERIQDVGGVNSEFNSVM